MFTYSQRLGYEGEFVWQGNRVIGRVRYFRVPGDHKPPYTYAWHALLPDGTLYALYDTRMEAAQGLLKRYTLPPEVVKVFAVRAETHAADPRV